MSSLNISGLSKSFNGQSVFSDISCNLDIGQVMVLMGANGAGKTTLLKSVMGLTRPDLGHIEIYGQRLSNCVGPKNVYYLPENFSIPYGMSAISFIKWSLGMCGSSASNRDIYQSLSDFGFDAFKLENSSNGYSKGMTQIVGLAAAFISGCELLILDEPMSGLDILAKASFVKLVKDFLRQGGSVLFTSHVYGKQFQEINHKIALLHRGKIRTYSPEFINENITSMEDVLLNAIIN